jgi:hypothetical protein
MCQRKNKNIKKNLSSIVFISPIEFSQTYERILQHSFKETQSRQQPIPFCFHKISTTNFKLKTSRIEQIQFEHIEFAQCAYNNEQIQMLNVV